MPLRGRPAKGYVTLRFTGQIKIPDLDSPGVPASVVLDGKQVELFVEGESLGRWSLVDVRAERLISSAFSLKLSGEEVTFIADQPTEFAYGGVDEMANVWARHRTMRLPRRIIANSISRRGTKPSRIADLREAIEETLTGVSPTALAYGRAPARKETSGVASLRDTSTGRKREEADIDGETPAEAREPAEGRATAPDPEPAPAPRSQVEPAPASADVPAGTTEPTGEDEHERRDPVPDSPDTPDVVFAEPDPEFMSAAPETDSVFKDSVPWAKREEDEAEEEPEPEHQPSPPAPASAEEPSAPPADHFTKPEPPPAAPPSPEAPDASVPWIAPQSPDPIKRSELAEPARPAASEEGPPSDDRTHLVNLGAFEDRGDPGEADSRRESEPAPIEPDTDEAIEPDTDEAEVQPLAPASARGGLVGAVRSAFVRNRVEHTHEYVEAPGGLGIKRQICAECGHISIGVE